jgi:hypothetical protein
MFTLSGLQSFRFDLRSNTDSENFDDALDWLTDSLPTYHDKKRNNESRIMHSPIRGHRINVVS